MIPSLVGNGSKVETIRGSFQLGRLEKYSPVRSKVSWIYTRNIVLEKRVKYLLGGEKLEYPKKLSCKIIKSFKMKLSSPFLVNSSRRGRWWNDRNKRRKGGVVKNLRAGRKTNGGDPYRWLYRPLLTTWWKNLQSAIGQRQIAPRRAPIFSPT